MGVKDTANLALIPAAYKASKVYSALPTDGDGDFTFTRTGSGTRINKAGLIETVGSNVPRLNYRLDADGNVSSCPELLLEPQRTNSTTYSEDFTQTSYWGNVIDVVVTKNQTTAPNGSNTANKIQANSGSNFKILRTSAFTIPSGITMSMFVKRGNHDYIVFKAQGDYNFNLSTLEWGSNYSNVGYQLYPNDWVRLYATTSSSVLSYFGIYLTDSSFNQSWNATGNEYVYVWGAQYETSSFRTSYIPTLTGSAVTRNKDQAYKANFADLASDYPITVYWKGRILEYNGFNCAFSLIEDGQAGEFLLVSFNTSSQVLVRRARGGSEDVDFITYNTQLGDVKKIAIKFTSATSYVLYIDGIEIYKESSGTSRLWNYDSVLVGQFRISADTGQRNPADELFIFNKALTDAEMVEITSYTSFTEMATQQQFTIQ